MTKCILFLLTLHFGVIFSFVVMATLMWAFGDRLIGNLFDLGSNFYIYSNFILASVAIVINNVFIAKVKNLLGLLKIIFMIMSMIVTLVCVLYFPIYIILNTIGS
jgi:hypothetical protein